MNITAMIAELRAEREHVEQAILVLERMALGQGRERGRPPDWMTQVKCRGRPQGSAVHVVAHLTPLLQGRPVLRRSAWGTSSG